MRMIKHTSSNRFLIILEAYGIQWDDTENKIVVDDFREVQRRLAQRT